MRKTNRTAKTIKYVPEKQVYSESDHTQIKVTYHLHWNIIYRCKRKVIRSERVNLAIQKWVLIIIKYTEKHKKWNEILSMKMLQQI